MKLEMFAVYDLAVQAFAAPVFLRSRGEAIRSFSAAVEDEKTGFLKNPADFQFFFLGVWDDSSGLFEGPAVPELIATATQFVVRT